MASCSPLIFGYPAQPLCRFGNGLLRDQGRNDDGAFVTWEADSCRYNLRAAVLFSPFIYDNAIRKN